MGGGAAAAMCVGGGCEMGQCAVWRVCGGVVRGRLKKGAAAVWVGWNV